MWSKGSLIALTLSLVSAVTGDASQQPPRRGDRDRDATIARLEREIAQMKRELQQLQRRTPRMSARPGLPGQPGVRFEGRPVPRVPEVRAVPRIPEVRGVPRVPEVRQGFRGERRPDPRVVPGRPARPEPRVGPEQRLRFRESVRPELQRGAKPELKPGMKFEFKHAKPGVKHDHKESVKAGAKPGAKHEFRPGDRPGSKPGERTPPPARKRRVITEA